MFFLRRLWNGETERVTTAALIVGAASLASRLVGLLRDRMLASTFGAGDVLDAYYAAFRIPDFLYNLVILGALSAAFIPVFTEYLERRNKSEAWELAERVLSVVGTVMAGACIILFFAAPALVPLTVPGFAGEKLALTVTLSRIMLGSTFFLALSGVMGGILQATRRFVAFSLAPVFYNLGIILGMVFLVPLVGPAGLGFGVVAGALLHFVTQSSVAMRLGLARIPFPSFRHGGVRKILALMAPRTAGLAVTQVNLVVIQGIASTLTMGSVAVMNLAMNLQSVPVGIIGVSFAVAAFPALSRAASAHRDAEFREAFGATARKIVFLVLPVAALIIILRAQIVRLVLGAGQFNWEATVRTADALAVFSLSLIAQALVPLLARAFYAVQDTWTPLWTGIASEAVNIILALLLAARFGLVGLIVAFTVAAWVSLFLLWWRLRARRGRLGTREVMISLRKTLAACIILSGAALAVRILVGSVFPLRTFWQVALQAGLASGAGLLAFWGAAWLMRSHDLADFHAAFARRFLKRTELLEGAEEARG